MPNREYICDNCDYTYEVYQPLHEELHKKCPECKANKLYQNLQGITGTVKNITTLGQLAEQNTKKLGTYGWQKKLKEEQDAKDNMQRERAKEMSKRFNHEFIPKCDRPEPKIKPLSKDVKKKLFVDDKKLQSKRIEKYIRDGEV